MLKLFKAKSVAGALIASLMFFGAASASAEIKSIDDQSLQEVEGQFLLTAAVLLPAYIAKEVIVGEILGEVLSIEEDVRIRLNLIDAFGPDLVPNRVLLAYVAKEVVVGEILGEILSTEEDIRIGLNLIDAFRPGNT